MKEDKTADETKKDIKLFNECIDRLKEIGNQNLSLFTNNLQQGNLNTIKFLFDKYIKRNKQLEKDNNNKSIKIIEYEKTLEKLQKETIWTSKVEEKIEEINNEKLNHSEDEYYLENEIKGYAMEHLRELLREEK